MTNIFRRSLAIHRRLLPPLVAALLALGSTAALRAADESRLLTSEEIVRVDRENTLWRLVRVDANLSANLAGLRSNGVLAAELDWFEPKLAAAWDVPLHREFGWMRPDQVEAIKAVDDEFVARLRSARVRREVGIELDPAHRGETVLAVLALWRRTLLRTLDYDQFAEFRLMNSPSAERAARFFENIPLSDDERRTVYAWQSEFDRIDPPFALTAAALEYRLDHWSRLRDLLGDERMALYLSVSQPGFARMWNALGPEVSSPTALDSWRILQELLLQKKRGVAYGDTMGSLQERAQARFRALIGEEVWAHFAAAPDAHDSLVRLGIDLTRHKVR